MTRSQLPFYNPIDGADAGSGPGNSDNLVAVVINNVFSHKGHYKLLAVSLYNNNIGAEACGQDP